MAEWKLFGDTIPEHATPGWYAERDHAPHLEQEGHRQRLLLTAEMVREAVNRGGTSLVDLGAGDGGLLQAVRELGVEIPAWGYDLQPSNVAASVERKVSVELGDFDVDPIRWADIAVMSEVLEHLPDPHAMVARIHAAGPRFLIATSPYTETDQSHYGFHLWAWDIPGYAAMFEAADWQVVMRDTAWISQVLLLERHA